MKDSLETLLEDIEKIAAKKPIPVKKVFTKTVVTSDTRKAEAEAIVRWKQTRNQADFDFLWNAYQGIINKEINKYSMGQYGSSVPREAFKGEAMKLFVKALETYDPKYNTAFTTHLTHYLHKLYRFNLQYQNIARISSEKIAGKITTFQNRRAFLEEKLGRQPTNIELADDLSWSLKDVERIQRDTRPDIVIGSQFSVEAVQPSTKFMDKLNTLYYFDTTPKEKLVLEYTFGLGGKPVIKSNIEIAKKINVTPNRVSQIKAKMARKLQDK